MARPLRDVDMIRVELALLQLFLGIRPTLLMACYIYIQITVRLAQRRVDLKVI